MKALVKYIVYPPLSKHFYNPYKYIKNNVKNTMNSNILFSKKYIKNNMKNMYCNIWIRKNF